MDVTTEEKEIFIFDFNESKDPIFFNFFYYNLCIIKYSIGD